MKREKVYIILSHKHSLRAGSGTDWEVSEKVEFVNQLRKHHYTMSSAIGDFLKREMVVAGKAGISNYEHFEDYVRNKYASQFNELSTAYGHLRSPVIENSEFVDQFGNKRQKTVFDI